MSALHIAITSAACRVLTRRAHALRSRAAALTTTATDSAGRTVRIVGPEATVMIGTADFFDSCAAELAEVAHD